MITCWVLRRKQVCSWPWVTFVPSKTPQAAVVSASPMLGTLLVARHFCNNPVLSASTSCFHSLKRRNPCLNAAHLYCSMSWGPAAVPVNAFNISAADFPLHVFCTLGFLSKWDPEQGKLLLVQSAHGSVQIEAQMSSRILYQFSVGQGSLYLLCFSERLDSLDLHSLAAEEGRVVATFTASLPVLTGSSCFKLALHWDRLSQLQGTMDPCAPSPVTLPRDLCVLC